MFDAGFGNWEKHTKGVGKKLLMKMGFKGRLGKNEDGVTRQLEAKADAVRIGVRYLQGVRHPQGKPRDRSPPARENIGADGGGGAAGGGLGPGKGDGRGNVEEKRLWQEEIKAYHPGGTS